MDHIGVDVHNKDSQIPTRKTAPQVAVYAPLAAAPVPPDVMLVCGNARQLMLLAEAAQAAGVGRHRGHQRGAAGGDQLGAHRRQLRLHRQPRRHRRRRH
jgi:hypothetical protein